MGDKPRFSHPAWIPVAWALSIINIGATWFAAVPAEAAHATVHALLAAAFAVGAMRLSARRAQTGLPSEEMVELLDQNERLQETIDGMQATMSQLEQRASFAERVLTERRDSERQTGS
jgi:hypothetical protein